MIRILLLFVVGGAWLNCLQAQTPDLLGVVVIFRHGDRTPVSPYPNDPYKNRSFWPVNFGQLTNEGKMRHFELGKWFRNRYSNYLPQTYSDTDITVRSSDVDRTLMSAESNLAGLYPPAGSQMWNPNLTWQPIPIHTTPEAEDPVLAMKKKCPKYNLLYKQLFRSDYFQKVKHMNHELYAYLTLKSGNKITTLETLEYLYNTLSIEKFFNFTLPDWAERVFPKMQPWAFLSFATSCYTESLARLKTGLLFNEIVEYFRNKTSEQPQSQKLMMYSGHDTTIANVLNTMGAFEYHAPPYASTIIFELRKSSNKTFINIFYKNSSIPQQIILKGCEFNCDLDSFVNILSPITLTRAEWNYECGLSWVYFWPLGFSGNVILMSLFGCVIFGVIGMYVSLRMVKKTHESSYIQLPNEEYA